MTSSSLVGAIFGGDDESSKHVDNANSKKNSADGTPLSKLFDESKALPAKPQHTTINQARVKNQPTGDLEATSKRKKPRKRKADTEALAATADATVDAAPAEKTEQTQPTAEDRTIFVGNLPLITTRRELASLFKACGKIESSRLRSVAAAGVKLPPEHAGDQNLVKKVCANTGKLDVEARSSAQGYVVFRELETVEKALELNGTLHPDSSEHRLRVDRATPTHDASRSVFVGNLPYHAKEVSLQALFVEKCGLSPTDVEGVRIVRDKETMKCKGFGYVLFANKSMVVTALQKVHGSTYLKRELRVTVCGKRTKGRRGQSGPNNKRQKRSFEGNRAVAAGAMQRIVGANKKSGHAASPGRIKKRRARGETKNAPHSGKKEVAKAGVSRRAAAEAKVGKRIKKIQKRISKGMGKARK